SASTRYRLRRTRLVTWRKHWSASSKLATSTLASCRAKTRRDFAYGSVATPLARRRRPHRQKSKQRRSSTRSTSSKPAPTTNERDVVGTNAAHAAVPRDQESPSKRDSLFS